MRLPAWLARAITEVPEVRLHRQSAVVEVTHRHLPAVAAAAAVMDRLPCQLRNVVLANKDPRVQPDQQETKAVQEKMAVTAKTEATVKTELSEKLTLAVTDMVMEMEAPNPLHLALCVHLVHPVRPVLRDPKAHRVPKEVQAVPLRMANEVNAVKLEHKVHPVVPVIQDPKDPMVIPERLIQSKAPPVPPVQPEKKAPKVQLVHPVKMANPVTPEVEAEKVKMGMQAHPANQEHPEVQAGRALPVQPEVATIVQRHVRRPDIRTIRLETIFRTHDIKIYALFLFITVRRKF